MSLKITTYGIKTHARTNDKHNSGLKISEIFTCWIVGNCIL